jgi:hypothetical protein
LLQQRRVRELGSKSSSVGKQIGITVRPQEGGIGEITMEIHSAVLGNVNVNTRRQHTQADIRTIEEAAKQLRKNGFDDLTEEGLQRNGDLLHEYFESNPTVPVTIENIFRAIESRKQDYKWLSPAAHEWYQAAQQNQQLANDLANHLAGHGQPGRLVNAGDPLFENLLLLFNEINSRRESATSQTILAAQDRIAHRPEKQLQYVPQPRRTEPVSRAAKEDDGSGFLKKDMVRTADGGWRSKTPAEQKAEREAQEAANQPTAQDRLSVEDREWKSMSQELLRYGTHGQQATIRQTYDQAVQFGASWRRIFEACKLVVKQYKRAAALSGGVR